MKARKGFTLVEIMIVIAIIALLASIAIPNFVSSRKSANDVTTKATLRTIQTALENYAVDNNGQYPAGTDLSKLIPSYIRKDYCASGNNTFAGHTFTCSITTATYNVNATKVDDSTANKDFNLTPSGISES